MSIPVTINICALVLFCDESLLSVDIGHGYHFKKICLSDFPYKDRITYTNGELDIAYRLANAGTENDIFLMCLEKHDVLELPAKQIPTSSSHLEEPFEPYKEHESEYLGRMFSLLRIYQEGNIGRYDVFYDFDYKVGNAMSFHPHFHERYQTLNILDDRRYVVHDHNIDDVTRFLKEYSGRSYDLLQPAITEFVLGMERMDSSGFIQYMIALEMLLLQNDGSRCKSVQLANRVAVLIGSTDEEIQSIQSDVLTLYDLRSKYVHEGNWSAITADDLYRLEKYVRLVLQKCLAYCKYEIDHHDDRIEWPNVKNGLINDLTCQVTKLQTRGFLPPKKSMRR